MLGSDFCPKNFRCAPETRRNHTISQIEHAREMPVGLVFAVSGRSTTEDVESLIDLPHEKKPGICFEKAWWAALRLAHPDMVLFIV
jgi:hypothetical protein